MLRLEYKRNKAVEEYVSDNLSDKEIENYYNENTIGDIKAKHILISPEVDSEATEEEKEKAEEKAKKQAENIIKKLEKGEDFEELAKKYSDDSATANDGGELGYFNTDDMDENFIEEAKKLKNNEYTKKPIKTQYGYHIILKEDQKNKPKLKKVKDSIKETLTNYKLENDSKLHYESLIAIREENNITWNDDELEKEYEKLMDQLLDATSASTTN